MSAQIFILPVTRGMNAPGPELPCDCEPASEPSIARMRKPELFELLKGPLPAGAQIPYQVALDVAVAEKLEDAAELANIETEKMLQALIIWGLKQVELMPETDFYNSLTAVAGSEC